MFKREFDSLMARKRPTVVVLEEVKALVARAWIQDTQARNNQGEECFADDTGAVCWCLTGAMRAALYKCRNFYVDPCQRPDDTGAVTKDTLLMRSVYERIGWGIGMRTSETSGVALGDIERRIGQWNDDQRRTQAEVVGVVEAVLVKEREAAA